MTVVLAAVLAAVLAPASPPAPDPAWASPAVAAATAGDRAALTIALHRLATTDRARAAALRNAFARYERNGAAPKAAQAQPPGVIVVFGSALDGQGQATPTLFLRLEAAEVAARAAPGARLVLSGGVPRAGRTEADVMAARLVARGVDRGRLVFEDQSRDTVGNALYVARLICDAGSATRPGPVALVTSASHMPRARTLLELALAARGCTGDVQPLPAPDAPSDPSAETLRAASERQAAYRDLVRVLDAGRPSRN